MHSSLANLMKASKQMYQITRLVILIAFMACSQLASAKEWPFTAYLDGKEIGQHDFRLTESSDVTMLTSIASFNVKVLFINAYRYEHKANEQWRDGCLSSLDARTRENGEVSVVTGKKLDSSFEMKGPKGKLELPACTMTFAYWNPKMLSQEKLLNPQTGEWLDVDVVSMGRDSIVVRGLKVEADRYRLTAPKMKIDLWYSPDKEWLGLESTTPDGYQITYKLR